MSESPTPTPGVSASRLRGRGDLALVLIGTALAGLAILLLPEKSLARAFLVLAFALVAPGYALVAAVFPEAHDPRGFPSIDLPESGVARILTPVERATLSIGLGVALVPTLLLASNYSPWGLGAWSGFAAFALFTLAALAVADRRRAGRSLKADPAHKRPLPPPLPTPPSRRGRWPSVALALGLSLAIGGAGLALVDVLATPSEPLKFTTLAARGIAGSVDPLPPRLAPGESATFRLSVENQEGAHAAYTLAMIAERGRWTRAPEGWTFESETREVVEEWRFDLSPRARWEWDMSFHSDAPGDHRIRYELGKSGSQTFPYRALELAVTVAP